MPISSKGQRDANRALQNFIKSEKQAGRQVSRNDQNRIMGNFQDTIKRQEQKRKSGR